MKFEKQTITIKIGADGDHQKEVDAEVFGLLAVHPMIEGSGNTVTHIPTGGALVLSLSLEKAKKLAEDILELEIDLAGLTMAHIRQKSKKYRPLAELIYAAKKQPEKLNSWPV